MILLSICSSLKITSDRGKLLSPVSVLMGDEKGSVIKFAYKILNSMRLKDFGDSRAPWNDDIIVHFKYNKFNELQTFIHISHDSGLDYILYTDFIRDELNKEYIDKIKRIYGKDFERREDGSKN